jgi:hypothetical protein
LIRMRTSVRERGYWPRRIRSSGESHAGTTRAGRTAITAIPRASSGCPRAGTERRPGLYGEPTPNHSENTGSSRGSTLIMRSGPRQPTSDQRYREGGDGEAALNACNVGDPGLLKGSLGNRIFGVTRLYVPAVRHGNHLPVSRTDLPISRKPITLSRRSIVPKKAGSESRNCERFIERMPLMKASNAFS